MRAEVWKGKGKQPWRWHFRARNGRIVAASGEGFPSRGHALRAARACVRAVIGRSAWRMYDMDFTLADDPKRPGVTIVRW